MCGNPLQRFGSDPLLTLQATTPEMVNSCSCRVATSAGIVKSGES